MDLSKLRDWMHSQGWEGSEEKTMKPESIMIIENNPDFRNTLRLAFEKRGYITWTCPEPAIADSIVSLFQPQIVILDIDAVPEDATSLLDSWREEAPHTRVVVQSRYADADSMRSAMEHGASAYLVKPFSLEPLFQLLEKAGTR